MFYNLKKQCKELEDNQTVYVVKDSSGTPKSITTNVLNAIQKAQK